MYHKPATEGARPLVASILRHMECVSVALHAAIAALQPQARQQLEQQLVDLNQSVELEDHIIWIKGKYYKPDAHSVLQGVAQQELGIHVIDFEVAARAAAEAAAVAAAIVAAAQAAADADADVVA